MFTLFVLTIPIFFLHNSQKCITFAPDLEKDLNQQLSPLNYNLLTYENEFIHIETANAGFSPAFVR